MAERIVSHVNVWTTKSQPSIDSVVRSAHELVSLTRHSKITPELISKLFCVGIPKAKEMLEETTQKGIRQAIHPLTRRYRVDHLNLHRNELGGQWTLDHLESRVKSIRGNTGDFTISNGNFVEAYAKPSKSKDQHQAADSLRRFCKDVGIPVNLKTDMAGSFEGRHTVYQEVVRKNYIISTASGQARPAVLCAAGQGWRGCKYNGRRRYRVRSDGGASSAHSAVQTSQPTS